MNISIEMAIKPYFAKCQMALKAIGLFCLSLSLTACISHSMDLNFQTHRHVNPDAYGQSLPVQVKVFQLKNDLAFMNTSFDDLWQQGQQALGETWLAEQDIVLLPGTHQSVSVRMNSDAEYVAFMGVFRNRHGKTWRVIRSIPHFYIFEPHYLIVLQGNQLTVKQEWF